jgi:hypothetical protein
VTCSATATMNAHRTGWSASVSCALLLVPACASERVDQPPAADPVASVPDHRNQGVTNAQPLRADDTIVAELAAARCDRAQACGNLGAGGNYASREECESQMLGSVGSELGEYHCAAGIAREPLEHCVFAIRNEDCGSPLDTLDRLALCRMGALCMKK